MSQPASWEDRFLSLLNRPGQWVSLGPTSDTQAGAQEVMRRARYRSTLNGEIDLANVQHRVTQLGDGRWAYQARYVVVVDTPRFVTVQATEGTFSEVMTAGSLLVTPGVVSQHSKRWTGDRNVIVFHASSPAHHNVMRWVLPRDVAHYVRLSLNLMLGGNTDVGSIRQ